MLGIMKIKNLLILLFSISVLSCSTGKKALQKGDYYSAISKAVDRLKSDPDNTKALQVLKEGYPLALTWSQEELDFILTANQAFKWEDAINIMHQVNRLSEQIRRTPAARKIIREPKTYGSELNMAYEKAAKERYLAGTEFLEQGTREDAKTAFSHFQRAEGYIPHYEDVQQKLMLAKEMATLQVVVEAAMVRTRTYKLSSEFFYNQVFEYLNNQFPSDGFVNFLSPQQAENFQVTQPDFIVQMEFFDFSVGNLIRHENEQALVRTEKVAINDTTEVTKTYRAKLKTFTDEVISQGRLNYKIVDFQSNKLMRDQLVPGSFTWINEYAIFVGEQKALTEQQYLLTKNRALPLPPNQEVFIEFTRPIYERLSNDLYSYFRRYR